MKKLHLIFIKIILILSTASAYSQEPIESIIKLSQMGEFKVSFSPIERAELSEQEQILGMVTTKPQSTLKMVLPFSTQKASFFFSSGSRINKGDLVAQIHGPQVHHFIDEMNAAKTIYTQSKTHLNAVKDYTTSDTIKYSEWLDTNKSYLEAKLNFEHFNHVMKQIKIADTDEVFLVSPSDGIILLSNTSSEYLYELVTPSSLFIKSSVIANKGGEIVSFNISNKPDCKLSIDSIESVINNYKQTVWTSFNTSCDLTIGQQVVLTPIVQRQGYSIPQKALFEIDNRNFVASKNNGELRLIEVQIIGNLGINYVVQSEGLDRQSEVLTSSVNIAQGLFLGLGS